MLASAIALQARPEREERTQPDDQLEPGECEADRMIRDQPIFPFRRLTVIAEDRRPGRVDRSGAPLHRLADWHHSGDPGNRDGEAGEAEPQAGRGAEHRQRAGVRPAESHARESSLSGVPQRRSEPRNSSGRSPRPRDRARQVHAAEQPQPTAPTRRGCFVAHNHTAHRLRRQGRYEYRGEADNTEHVARATAHHVREYTRAALKRCGDRCVPRRTLAEEQRAAQPLGRHR
jgi:hypothetical protein